jgi:hypothetical protein
MIDLPNQTLNPDVPRWRTRGGEPLSAGKLNRGVDAINALRRGVRPARQLPIRVRPEFPPGATGRFVFSAMGGDWVFAHPADDSDTLIKLAKPWLLRRTPFDGETREGTLYRYETDTLRVASKADPNDPLRRIEERQLVIPRFVGGDVLYATKDVIGGSGVFDSEDVELEWLDDNRDGRAWAKEA